MKGVVALLGFAVSLPAVAGELPTCAGPAMGTTYRVTLARDLPGMSLGEVHCEIEDVLARVDRAISAWRSDSDASRFNRAAAGVWVNLAADLVAVVMIARRVSDDSGGAFDITMAPGAVAGMHLVEIRPEPPALRKARDVRRSRSPRRGRARGRSRETITTPTHRLLKDIRYVSTLSLRRVAGAFPLVNINSRESS